MAAVVEGTTTSAPGAPAARQVEAPGWRYAAAGKRDLRLDFLRGFAVVAMVVDHLGGDSWLYALTGGNRFLVSAAEGFVFISGAVAGIVYGDRVRAAGWRAAVPKLLLRAWTLYTLAVWLGISTALLAALFDLPGGSAVAEAPARFVLEVVALRRTFYLVDVMLLYAFLMLLAPLALGLLARGRWRLLALASCGLWAAYQLWPRALQLPWPIAGNSVFKLGSWQVLFFAGLTLGYERERLARRLAARWPRSPLRDGWLTPLALLLGALIWVHATDGAAFDRWAPGGSMAAVLDAWFDKSALPPARLAACAVVFAFGWALVTRLWHPLRAAAGGLLLPLGQGALYAYAAHLYLVVAVHLAVVWVWGSGEGGSYPFLHPGVNALLQVGAVAVLWALTRGRVLQPVVAPLGTPPLSRLPARLGRWPLWRPSDALVAILLVALVAGNAAVLGARDSAANARVAPRPAGAASGRAAGQGNASRVSTVVAPRKVAGPARGSSQMPPTASAAVPTTGAPGAQQGEAAPTATMPAVAVAGGTPTPTPTSAEATLAGGYLRDGEFYSRTLGRTMPYGIYLPPGYDADAQRYPVLYMLHGAGGGQGHYSEWVTYGLTEAVEELIATGQIPPLLIVLPQGDQSYWVNHAGADDERWGDYVARDLVEYVDATYRTLPTAEHRAIGGLSMGGFGALSLAFTHPDVFGVAGAHSPSLRGWGDVPAYLGDADAYKKVDPLELALALDPLTAPRLWLDVGEEDQWGERVNALHKLLSDRAIEHDYRVTPGGHDGDYWRGHDAEYLRFYAAALLAP